MQEALSVRYVCDFCGGVKEQFSTKYPAGWRSVCIHDRQTDIKYTGSKDMCFSCVERMLGVAVADEENEPARLSPIGDVFSTLPVTPEYRPFYSLGEIVQSWREKWSRDARDAKGQ